jgi:tetratricopeptide (TPR) repeat protein
VSERPAAPARGHERGLRRAALLAGACALALSLLARPADAQESPAAPLVSKALEAESSGKNREAIAAWRAAIDAGAVLAGVLGLERVFSVLAQEDSLLAVFDTIIPRHPREWQLRAAQLRTFSTLGLDERAAKAFAEWRTLTPNDVIPFREYARVLLYNGRAAQADTVIRMASDALGSTRALVLEVAQMRAALGLWKESAEAWRDVMAAEQYYEQATVFSLQPAPASARDAVRAVLSRAPPSLAALQSLALLEVGWNSPRNGWTALRSLQPSDTVVALWRQFADEVERARAWTTARDVFVAIHAARPDADIALRGAQAALKSDDAATALRLARGASPLLDEPRRYVDVLPIELDALARLGQAREAEAVLAKAMQAIGDEGARLHARTIAWAWIRAGDIGRARLALADAPLAAEDAVTGWLALFDGDLATARGALRNTEVPGQDVVSALSLLNRTRLAKSEAIGMAFLALARGDSTQASKRFEEAAVEVPEGAALLITLAARIETARRSEERALTLWRRVAEEHKASAEAPEAQLEWARSLRRRGDVKGAREHLESLIPDYPDSALVPQARRELDALRGIAS